MSGNRPHDDTASRRAALQRLFALAAMPAVALPGLAGCGGGGPGNDPIPLTLPPPPGPTPSAPAPRVPSQAVSRLLAALAMTAPDSDAATQVTLTQGSDNSLASSFGSAAQFIPTLPESATNNLATTDKIYGYRRDLWPQPGGSSGGVTLVPVQRIHVAATETCIARIGLHFEHVGSAFELLVAGACNAVTLIVDGRYVGYTDGSKLVQLNTSLTSGVLTGRNTMLKFDFGSRAKRRISLYLQASQGALALATAAGDTVTAWDRDAEASFSAMADSYGGAPTRFWGWGGLFYQAAAALGIPNVDLDAIGGTGYAIQPSTADTLIVGNMFDARIADLAASAPDLVVTAGGLNDNNALAETPYATAAAAATGFVTAVETYFSDLRAKLPDAVLVALGPWQPPKFLPAPQSELDKRAAIKTALAAVGGDWIFIDNFNGGWINSSGATAAPSADDGPWQTTGNAALYIDSEDPSRTHPNAAGCAYLADRLATSLRAAILAL